MSLQHKKEASYKFSKKNFCTWLKTGLGVKGLTAWFNGKKAIAVPIVWEEPGNLADYCYFCLTNVTGFNASSRKR